MEKRKKWLSVLLCAALLLGLLPVAAMANPTAEISVTITRSESNGKTGDLFYQLNGGARTKVTTYDNESHYTVTANGHSSITIWAKPTGEASQVNLSRSSVTPAPQGLDLNALTSQAGLTISFEDGSSSYAVTVEFDNNNGTGGNDPQNPPVVSQGDIKFEIGGDPEGGALAYSIGNDTAWHDASDGMVISKNDLPASSTIYVKAALNSGYQLDDYVDNGVSVNQVRTNGTAASLNFTENVASFSYSAENTYEVTIRFMTSHGPGGGGENNPGSGTTPDPTDFEGAKAYIEGWDLAYYGADAEAVKTLMATELWNEGFCVYNGHTGDYTGMFDNLNAFKGAITLSGSTTTDGSEILGLPYYTYTVMLHDVDGTENDIKAEGRVYKLSDAKDFGVKIGTNEYRILNTSTLQGGDNDIYIRSVSNDLSNIKVFGNGVCSANVSLGSGEGWAAHITQDHSGLTGGPGCRLVVLPANYTGVKIVSEVTAAAWGFAEVPIFATGSNSSPVAEIYYGNDGTAGRTVTISQIKDSIDTAIGPAITNITVDRLQVNSNVATITSNDGTFTVAFNSGYDVIPLEVTYADNSTEKLTIHRVGLHLEDNHVNGSTYQISHGTDRFESYNTANAQRVVTAAFYYNTGTTKPTKSVSLFVTIKTATGTTHKVVTRLNNDFIETTGNDKWADDFLLWSGTDEEYANLISISAIAYSEGENDSFGGVKAGSGTGVEWVKSDHAE